MRELPHHLTEGRGAEREGEKPVYNPFNFPPPSRKQSCQPRQPYSQVGESVKSWHTPQPVHGHHFSRFKLCCIFNKQRDKTSFSNSIFPMPSSLPSAHACITGSFGDPPPAKHHQIPRMLPADTRLTLRSWLETLCRTKDREESTASAELSTHHVHVGEDRSRKTGGAERVSAFLFPSLPVPRRWEDMAGLGKAHCKNLGHLRFHLGHSKCYIHKLYKKIRTEE